MAEKKRYKMRSDGWLYGTLYAAGDMTEPLTDKQADYPLRTGVIEAPAEPKAKASPRKAPAKASAAKGDGE